MRKLSLIVMAALCACGGYFAGGIGKREAQHAAVSVCVATKAKGGALSVDVGLCLEQLIAKRRVDISKEACGLVLACTRANGDVVKDACAALAEVGVAIDKIDTCNCRVNLSSRASSDEAAELAVRSYARALKMIVEGDEVYNRIIGRSYYENDNIQLQNLRYIKLIHRNYEGQTQVGELIVNEAIEADIIDIFTEFYLSGYQVYSMFLIDNFWTGDGDSSDFASIDVNNTSAFCYRTVTGSSTNLSNHAYGLAIDLNPLENPYVRFDGDGYGSSAHANAQAYNNNRSSAEMPHVIDHEDLAFQLFAQHGSTWGGDWNNPKDYQHFQKELG